MQLLLFYLRILPILVLLAPRMCLGCRSTLRRRIVGLGPTLFTSLSPSFLVPFFLSWLLSPFGPLSFGVCSTVWTLLSFCLLSTLIDRLLLRTRKNPQSHLKRYASNVI
jgi:hypothetical protein